MTESRNGRSHIMQSVKNIVTATFSYKSYELDFQCFGISFFVGHAVVASYEMLKYLFHKDNPPKLHES